MCLIVDNNIVSRVFVDNADPVYAVIHECLFQKCKQKVTLMLGGQLLTEYMRNNTVKRLLRVLESRGTARVWPEEAIEKEEATVKSLGICESNDAHVLALARVSRARILCTEDELLIKDFQKKELIDKPRGNIFSKPSHKKLLTKHCK